MKDLRSKKKLVYDEFSNLGREKSVMMCELVTSRFVVFFGERLELEMRNGFLGVYGGRKNSRGEGDIRIFETGENGCYAFPFRKF